MENNQNSYIQDIFKISIYKKFLPLNNKPIKEYCLNLKKENKGRIRSNSGGWQSNDLSHESLNDLYSCINIIANDFAKELNLKKKLSIDNIWVNINGYKDSNKTHSHPQSILSGVYYVKTPKNSGNIFFNNTSDDVIQHSWQKNLFNNYNCYNSPEWFLPSLEGYIYLFPSWLKHYVEPNMNEKEERISLSFNIK